MSQLASGRYRGIAVCSVLRSGRLHLFRRLLLQNSGGNQMVIADKLRALREAMNLSQGDVEKRTGLLRCYISRVENGHTVPAIETLEKLARAMEVPLYQLFYDGEAPPALPTLPNRKSADDLAWVSAGKDARVLDRFRRLLRRVDEPNRKLLLHMAQKMARPTRARLRA
jgi:transcriptional regulator with XRE-family HTH domain